ncbi:hypothetical protein ABFS82_06G127300 [Erythranthe guttata]|uniref:Mitochondrial glycoprotein family protein n=1 Tax=Erythranthe guttata TaxID=4155 RepID=A0A022R3M8_ERYGU|nr:PREDICTED: uncharacterized protein At2g39795, mitochondrial-like [Erythranthe guttata]EYU35247.1 hypothetical protein MIMGU_mgv1a012289mg [Erythranthe guttata]|eukprot:XP_012840041.1 PREDICTED: uncharacterized protein At2g39795, mitochondrial-like [Erythranthe guttata]
MSLTNAIRRVASRVAPLVTRASAGSQRCLHHHHGGSALFSAANKPSVNLLQRSFPSFLRHYSARPKSDETLLRVIEAEIECAVESNDPEDEELPPGFPFKIEDIPGQQTITLTREFNGEDISIEVHMPDVVTGDQDDESNDDADGEPNSMCTIPLVVRVSKRSGPSLEFGCTARPDEVAIDTLTIKDPNNSEDLIAYEGPDFGDLDENLQKAFNKYIEVRGVKPSVTNYLHGYMVDKDSKEYVTWLQNVQKFVQS